DVAGDREDRRAARALDAQVGEPLRAVAKDRRNRRETLRVIDGRRRAVQAVLRRERRLEARLALLTFEGVEQRRLLAADVRTRADDRVQVEVYSGALDVLAEPARLVRFLQRRLEPGDRLAQELAANIVVADGRADRVARDRHAFDQRMRVVAQDVAVVASAGLALVGVADEILLHRRFTRHERELDAGREAGAAAAAQARLLDLLDDRLAVQLLAEDALPGLIAADLQVVLERPGLARARAQRFEAAEVEAMLSHGVRAASAPRYFLSSAKRLSRRGG